MPLGWTFESLSEWINQMCESFSEEEQWILEEVRELSGLGLDSVNYWRGLNNNLPKDQWNTKAFKKSEKERIQVVHNIFIEKGLESPFKELSSLKKTKYNPDKKRGGKKKKGGRRRI